MSSPLCRPWSAADRSDRVASARTGIPTDLHRQLRYDRLAMLTKWRKARASPLVAGWIADRVISPCGRAANSTSTPTGTESLHYERGRLRAKNLTCTPGSTSIQPGADGKRIAFTSLRDGKKGPPPRHRNRLKPSHERPLGRREETAALWVAERKEVAHGQRFYVSVWVMDDTGRATSNLPTRPDFWITSDLSPDGRRSC